MTTIQTYENKSADAGAAFEDFHRLFAHYREGNDERLAQIESKQTADVITEEKVARMDRALDETKRRLDTLALERGRPMLGTSDKSAGLDHAQREHKAAFRGYMRSGDVGGCGLFLSVCCLLVFRPIFSKKHRVELEKKEVLKSSDLPTHRRGFLLEPAAGAAPEPTGR